MNMMGRLKMIARALSIGLSAELIYQLDYYESPETNIHSFALGQSEYLWWRQYHFPQIPIKVAMVPRLRSFHKAQQGNRHCKHSHTEPAPWNVSVHLRKFPVRTSHPIDQLHTLGS